MTTTKSNDDNQGFEHWNKACPVNTVFLTLAVYLK